MEMNKMLDLYLSRREKREGRMREFFDGGSGFLVVQNPGGAFYNNCNTIESLTESNLEAFAKAVELEWTDDLPYLEPWIGTGVYANAFGCEYHWREGESPACHYRYHTIDEVKDIEYPDWRRSPIMKMVLDAIDDLKEKTGGALPISLTDTQSPFDTATLVLDASEFFTACYTDEDIVHSFMDKITRLLIEFSREQAARIGESILAKPGHIMSSGTFLRGISISDDNLAVSSPHINELVALPCNARIAEAFGGLAIHSCGPWTKTMSLLKDSCPGVFMIDCAGSLAVDPNPNSPAEIRGAMSGTGIITKVRIGNQPAEIESAIAALANPELPLILDIQFDAANAERNYRLATEKLAAAY